MKILLQGPTSRRADSPVSRQFQDMLSALAGRYTRPGTELRFRPGTGVEDPAALASLGIRFQTHGTILSDLVGNADCEVDGAIVYCFFDHSTWPARQLLDRPVTGLAESAMTMAPLIGRRFAILSPSRSHVQEVEDLIALYGRRANAISHMPVRAIGVAEACAMQWMVDDELGQLVDAVVPLARACIADGADVLIVGCGLFSVLLAAGAGLQEIDGVPIVVPLVAAIKTIETLVDLHRAGAPTKSAQGYWGKP